MSEVERQGVLEARRVVKHQRILVTSVASLVLLGLLAGLFWQRGRKRVMAALALILVLTVTFTPLLQGFSIHGYTTRRAQAAPDKTLSQALGDSTDKELVKSEGEANLASPPASQVPDRAAAVPPALATLECGDGGTDDTDLDSINDLTEICLGTEPYYNDSDRDLISDTLEINGFMYAGQRWYGNPLKADSNGDGLTDYFEWPAPAGSAPALDPDNDNVPNLWDDDNDGDGVLDADDLDPFSKTEYRASFSLQTTLDQSTYDGHQYIEIQVQPQDESHLRYAITALDWPNTDNKGTLQDLDNSTRDISFIANLKITTNNPPNGNLMGEYGVSAVGIGGGLYELTVPLNAVSNGGRIMAFEGKVAYAPDELNDINWSAIKLVWVAQMQTDFKKGNNIDVSSSPIADYEESAFRLTGLQVSKSGSTNYAIMGTPNAAQGDDRDLFTLYQTLGAAFLPNELRIHAARQADKTPISPGPSRRIIRVELSRGEEMPHTVLPPFGI